MRGSRPPLGNSATTAGDEATPLGVDNADCTDCTDDGGRSWASIIIWYSLRGGGDIADWIGVDVVDGG